MGQVWWKKNHRRTENSVSDEPDQGSLEQVWIKARMEGDKGNWKPGLDNSVLESFAANRP